MEKSICALAHKIGTNRRQFYDYYENKHAPLGQKLFPFKKYARNHIINGEFKWDVISEFWFEDVESINSLMNGSVGEIIRSDEELFMNRSLISPASSQEIEFSKENKLKKDGEIRTAILFDFTKDDGKIKDLIYEWAMELSLQKEGVSLDFIDSWGIPKFPASAIAWVSGIFDAKVPSDFNSTVLQVKRCATVKS